MSCGPEGQSSEVFLSPMIPEANAPEPSDGPAFGCQIHIGFSFGLV